jgi:[ribosomal protein S5]-alanine N-acetyltransferase
VTVAPDHVLATARMRLVPSTVERVRAEIGNREEFSRLVDARIPTDWPTAEAADALPWFLERLEAADPDDIGWHGWYGIVVEGETEAPVLVGGGGSLGPPIDGVVEIGYSVLPAFQRRGYATEMMRAILDWIERDRRVRLVRAETDAENVASRALLSRLGFREAGAGREPGSVAYENGRVSKP